jgi:superfamily I DNA and/or RNA helicase
MALPKVGTMLGSYLKALDAHYRAMHYRDHSAINRTFYELDSARRDYLIQVFATGSTS